MLISIGKAAIMLGVSVVTMRRWDRSGRLRPATRTCGGHRRYDHLQLLQRVKPKQEHVVLYARVSSADQKTDLIRQASRLESYALQRGINKYEVIQDIGSGINFKKRGLKRLIQLIANGSCTEIIVTYEDRLMRIGSELIKLLCRLRGIKLTILESVNRTREEALTQDVLTIITVYAARIYGARAHHKEVASTS